MADDRRGGSAPGKAGNDAHAATFEAKPDRETSERTSLDPRGWSRNTAIFATIGAAATGYLAVYAYSRLGRGSSGSRSPAFSEDQQLTRKSFNATRAAGPEAMRDPPKSWEPEDEASDESFPASDPPAIGSRVD